MKRFISTKHKLLVFISIALFLLMFFILLNVFINQKKDLANKEQLYRDNIVAAYKNTLHNYEVLYQATLENIISSQKLIEAIKDQNREAIYRLVKPKWEEIKKENKDVTIMHFHKPNGHTLLRMHNTTLYNDNIAEKRAMCRYIHKNKRPILAYEAGVHLLGYRIMVPIFDGIEYLGAIEIGIKPNFILNNIKKSYNISGVIFAKQDKIFGKELVDKNKLFINGYTLNSNALNDKDLVTYLQKDYKLDGNTRVEKDGRTYAVYYFEHKNFEGIVSVKTLVFNDITSLVDHFHNLNMKVLLFSFILYILIILVVKYGFERILNKMDQTNKELQNYVASLKSHQLALDASSIVTRSDLKGRITYVNDNFCKITGFTREEAIGKPHNIVRHPSNPPEMFEELWRTIKSKKVWKKVMINSGKLGDYYVDTAILPILDDSGDIVEYIAVRHDVTKMIKQQQKLDNLVNTDFLTGLGNRYKLIKDIKKSINPALAIFNVDSFSEINDFYGHEQGDMVIVELSKVFASLLSKQSCTIYHLQGDEFVIFDRDAKRDVFIKKMLSISESFSKKPAKLNSDKEIYINFTIAISFEDKNNIFTTADMALKIAKKENKHLLVYSEAISLNDQYKNNIKWANKVKKAIDNDNIVPVFQPIVNNSNEKWEKYESLVRIKDDENLISPYFFLDISKKTKQYVKITRIMIEKTFEMFRDRDSEFSINLTIEDILNEGINRFIFEMLERYGIGQKVVFEIVESESIENFEQVLSFIENIKSFGSKLAIDDFGTGYSNFEYLLKLKADYIKIDGSMIKDIDKNVEAQIVVSTIVDFAKKMGVKTIAEFVETESVFNKVKEMGIDYSQGYYFSAPKIEI